MRGYDRIGIQRVKGSKFNSTPFIFCENITIITMFFYIFYKSVSQNGNII